MFLISIFFFIKKESLLYTISIILLTLNFTSIILISLINNFRYQKLDGNFNGDLIFFEDKIILGEETILISEVKKIKIYNENHKGKYLWRKTLKPKLQQGIDNSIKIELLNGEIITKYFLQNKKNEITTVGTILKKYHTHNKIHFQNLIELLGMNDYNEIQKLKRELNNMES